MPPGDQAPANDTDGSADGERLGRFETLAKADPSFYAAVEALDEIAGRGIRLAFPEHAELHLWQIQCLEDVADWLDGDAFVDAANLIRRIGERATPEVIAQELHLKGHRDQGALKPIETLMIGAFRSNLLMLDQFAKGEAERRAAEEAAKNRPPPHHTPVEETTLDRGRGPLDRVF